MRDWKELDEQDCIQRMDALNVKGSYGGATYIVNSINGEFWEWVMPIAQVHGHKLDNKFIVWYDCQDKFMRLRGINKDKTASSSMKIWEGIMPPQLLAVYNELKQVKIKTIEI